MKRARSCICRSCAFQRPACACRFTARILLPSPLSSSVLFRYNKRAKFCRKHPGLELVDEPHSNRYPMPLNVAGKDNCQVGRVRLDCALENGLSFWVSGDQLLKGAALNAVQIAELL